MSLWSAYQRRSRERTQLDTMRKAIRLDGLAACSDYLDGKKEYIAQIKFGEISETGDEEGEKEFITNPDFLKEELEAVLREFLGKQKQIPPKYSAIKYAVVGKRCRTKTPLS